MCRDFESELDAAALTRIDGIRVENVAFFFIVADGFFKRAPWKRVRGDAIMRLQCEGFSRTPWFAVVMGHSGVAPGLALYEDLEGLRSVIRGRIRDVETGRSPNAMSLMFGREHERPIPDLDAAEANRWPIAGPNAYPFVMRMLGDAARPLRPAAVDTLSACVLVVPAFIGLPNAPSATFRVEGPIGPWHVRVAW